MPVSFFEPVPPEGLSPEQADAWRRGYRDGQIEGVESLLVVTPYDVDDQADLYEAWYDGLMAADHNRRWGAG
ncbi:MAG: hypothetical protein MK060_11240 [Blastomonas sp.]|uniref:hypothetical protein n=1 Tax=Blastomonas sp. TaxID=1909299 RepID=UPI00406A92CF|nr:hypothetical protein [Blastomonas sp.]